MADIAAEILSRHGHSAQPESQQLCAVLAALQQVIAAEGLSPSPTSFFAAGMSALDKQETRATPQVLQAVCTLLGIVMPRVPNGVLRAKWLGAANLISSVLKSHKDNVGVTKAALLVLSQLLAAVDPTPSAWPAAMPAMGLLLGFVTDTRAKVRKRAQSGLVEVLAALQNTPALGPASEAVARAAAEVLPVPEAAARAAAAASNKARAAAEEAITTAVANALHLIGALKQALPLMTAQSAQVVVDHLFKLFPLRQALLSRHATQALTALVSARSTHLAPATLADIVTVVIEAGDEVWQRRDPDVVLSLTQLVEGGMTRLAAADPGLCAARLPRVFHALVPQLAAEQDGVRYGTSQALRALIRSCISEDMVVAAVAARNLQQQQMEEGGPKGRPVPASPLQSVIVALASALGAQYREGWEHALPVVGEMMEVLGGYPGAGPDLASPLLAPLGQIVGGAEDAAEARHAAAQQEGAGAPAVSNEGKAASGPAIAAATAALCTALRALGPPAVLAVLPLNIREGLEGRGEPRTWMLPLLRRSVCGTQLGFWQKHLLPLARGLANESAKAAATGKSSLATSLHVLELQIWACLPAFVSWATDLPTVYPQLAKELAGAFQQREELRGPICAALERMVLQARIALRRAGAGPDVLGPSEPLGSLGPQDLDEEDEEYGGAPSLFSLKRNPFASGGATAGPKDGGEHHLNPPPTYTEQHAKACVTAIRGLSRNWLQLMCRTFLDSEPEKRGILSRCISALAVISERSVAAHFFRTAITKLLKVMEDSSKDVLPPDAIIEGGSDSVTRRVTFTELALVLATGLEDAGLETLLKAARPCLGESKEPALQKKGYKVLAYLCCARPGFLRTHTKEVLELVVGGASSATSACKRYRLRCLQPLILLLAGREPLPAGSLPHVGGDGDEEDMGEEADEEQRRKDVMTTLVTELMLCCKEANKKTRSAAYELLVAIGHAMDEMEPMSLPEDDDGGMDDGSGAMPSGGLATLFTMVMAGLAGQTPHMISSSIMALARLVYEFPSQLQPLVPQLLAPILSLLRSKSREVIKSVLGFVKVLAVRMPVDLLRPHLGPILEGVLLWAADSKNKFKLKVRVIVERLARRCGFDDVAAHIPPSESRLLTHIRKEHNRKVRRRQAASEAGDDEFDDGEDDDDRKSRMTGGPGGRARSVAGRTARASEWGHTAIFGEDNEEELDARSTKSGRQGGAKSVRSARAAAGPNANGRGGRQQGGGGSMRLQDGGHGGDPLDLLDPSASRHLTRTAAGAGGRGRDGDAEMSAPDGGYTRAPDGRLMIEDEDAAERARAMKRKRRAGDDYDSEDSDFEDLKGYAGLDAAMRSASKSAAYQKALSVKSGGARSQGGKSVGRASSVGGKSAGGRSAKSSGTAAAAGRRGPSIHSGDRFKAKSTAGGDVKGRSQVEPYAYWQFNRGMLNRRAGKKREAAQSLSGVVGAAQKGALRGAKAKAQQAAKRARR